MLLGDGLHEGMHAEVAVSGVVVTRPFAVFVEPDGNGCWIAHIVGFELDNCTQGDSPGHALEMAGDVLRLLMYEGPAG